MLATHEWSLTYSAARRRGPNAAAIIGDIAAITEATAELEHDLRVQHTAGHDKTITPRDDAFARATAAVQVRRLARTTTTEPRTPVPSHRHEQVLWIRSVTDAPAGFTRLRHLLRSAQHTGPESFRTLARAHAHTLLTISEILDDARLTRPRGPTVADGLREVAAALQTVARQTRSLRSLDSDDHRPIHQMRLLRAAWRPLDRDDTPRRSAHWTAAARSVRAALEAVPALNQLVTRHVTNRTWYHYDPTHRYPWRPTSPTHQERLVHDAQDVADAARSLIRQSRDLPAEHRLAGIDAAG